MPDRTHFIPAGIFALGCGLLLSVQAQRSLALAAPLASLEDPVPGYQHTDVVVPDDQVQVAGMSSYINRVYHVDRKEAFGLYIGYYESQRQGKTVHSPKNCLPGAGWEPVDASRITLAMPSGPAEVNRYVIANTKISQQALVYYWYQGRGRVAANEYLVKWHLLRDAALRRRTDEALVRLVVPIGAGMTIQQADALAEKAARELIVDLERHLPT